LRSESPSGMCAKLRTVAASNNRDHARNLSLRTLVVTFNRSHVNISRATPAQSLLLLLARGQYQQSYPGAISLTVACARYTYDGVILHAHPVHGESHNQRNTTGEVATIPTVNSQFSKLANTKDNLARKFFNNMLKTGT